MPKAKVRQYTAAILSCLSAFCSGSSYVWPAPLIIQFRQPEAEVHMTGDQISLVVSLVEFGNILTPLPTGYIVDIIGRKIVLLITGPLFLISGILILATRSPTYLYIMRIIQGLANGIVYTVLPLYLGELAEPSLRGIMTIFFTVFIFLGMLVTYIVGKFCTYQQLAWVITMEPVVFVLLFFRMPESPNYLLLKGKPEKAMKALKWLRGNMPMESVQAEFNDMSKEVSEGVNASSSKNPWKELFGSSIGRKSVGLGSLIVTVQVAGGFYSIFSYAIETLDDANIRDIDAAFISIMFTVATLIVAIIAALLVDEMGRRPMLLISGGLSYFAACMATIYFFFHEKTKLSLNDYEWILYFALIVLVASINFAMTSLIPTLQAELFPTSTRGIASSIMAMFQGLLCFIMLYIYLPISKSAGFYVNYLIFSVALSVGTCIIYLYFPETKGKTFAQIQEMLS